MLYKGLRRFTGLIQAYSNLHESVKGDLPGIELISRFIRMSEEKKYKTFRDFYPFYLTEHQNPVSRGLHFIGTGLIIGCLIAGIITGRWLWFIVIPVCGYGFAWFGHFFFEKNKPATFTYPLYSLGSDFVMFWHIITGQLPKKMQEAKKIIESGINVS